jgi:hypothetical protein
MGGKKRRKRRRIGQRPVRQTDHRERRRDNK